MDYVSQALVSINCSQGQFLLEDLSEMKVEANLNRKAVMTMNRLNRPRGTRGGVPEFTASWTVQTRLLKDVDLLALALAGEAFLMSWEEGPGDGDRFQMEGVTINTISQPYNSDGEATISVDLLATNWRKIPG